MLDEIDWIDALQPNAGEIAFLERCLELWLPTRADLVEVEASSRMSVVGDAVFLSMPATMRDADGAPMLTPIGFIVTKDRTTTIRFGRLAAFEQLAARSNHEGTPTSGAPGATISILETVVDHLADVLERAGNGLDAGLAPHLPGRPQARSRQRAAPIQPRAGRHALSGRSGGRCLASLSASC